MFASMNPGSTSTSTSAEKPKESEETPAETTETGDAEAGGPAMNLADQAGAGEEDEETVIEQRGKLFLFENGSNAVKGLGQFKLKRAKEAEGGKRKRRLLMRVAGNGNVILVRPSLAQSRKELMVEHDNFHIVQTFLQR
jgi:nucleoporin NUP2